MNDNNNHNNTNRTDITNSTATVPAGNGQGEGSTSRHSSISSVNHNVSRNRNWMAVPSQVDIVHDTDIQNQEQQQRQLQRHARRSHTHTDTHNTRRSNGRRSKSKNNKTTATTTIEGNDNDDAVEEVEDDITNTNPYKITRKQAIQTLLEDEELNDLQLRSLIDDQIVYAQRGWLASRSVVLRSLLYGNFKESKQSIIELPYPSVVLRCLVEFVYSDNITTLYSYRQQKLAAATKSSKSSKSSKSQKNKKKTNTDMELIETIISVIDAANYFAIPELATKIEQYTKRLLEEDESLVCLFLTACNNSNDDGGTTEAVDHHFNDMFDQQSTITAGTTATTVSTHCYSIPMGIIRSNPNLLLETNSSLEAMTSRQLEFVLRDKQLNADEYVLFQILYKWYNNNNSSDAGEDNDDDDGSSGGQRKPASSSSNSRLQDAMKLSKLIKLEYINPMELSTIVATSGIISMEQLTDAYKDQAIRAQQHHHISYHKSRSAKPVWYSSNTTKVTCSAKPNPTSGDWSIELLQLSKPLMSSRRSSSNTHGNYRKNKGKKKDVFKWKIYVNKDCQDTWLGVAEVSSSSSATSTGVDNNSSNSNNDIVATSTTTTAYSTINNNTTWLGGQSIGYIYGSSGWAWNNDNCMKRNLPTFTQGTTVTFILDLSTSGGGGCNIDGTNNINNNNSGRENNGNGTLRASIDDGVTTFDLFTNMLGTTTATAAATNTSSSNNNPWARNDDEDAGFDNNNPGNSNNNTKAFVPAAFLRHPGEVTFLGFE